MAVMELTTPPRGERTVGSAARHPLSHADGRLCHRAQMAVLKDGNAYTATLEIRDVTAQDAGKYKVTAQNELGESSAAISLNFDGQWAEVAGQRQLVDCVNVVE